MVLMPAAAFQRYISLAYGEFVVARRRTTAVPSAIFICFISFSSMASTDSVRFGGDATYPPFEFALKGKATGFNVDIAKVMGEAGGKSITYELGEWPETVAKLENGDLDVVPMFVSQSRSDRFAFSSPFYIVSHAIYAAEEAVLVHSVDELAGSRVAVEDRSYALEQLQELDVGIRPVLTASALNALIAVVQGRADYAVLATPIASTLIKNRKMKLRRLGPPFWSRPYAFAVRRDRTGLVRWVQSSLQSAMAEGAYQSVYEKWRQDLPDAGIADASRPNAWLFALGGVAFLLLVGGFVRLHQLRRRAEEHPYQIRQRTSPQTAQGNDLKQGNAHPSADRFIDQVDRMMNEAHGGVHDQSPHELMILELGRFSGAAFALDRNYSDQPVREVLSRLESVSEGMVGYLGRGLFAIYSTRDRVGELCDLVLAAPADSEYSLDSPLIIGSSLFPEHGKTAVDLIKCAETALTTGRSTGRRWIRYSPSMEPSRSDLEIVDCFRGGRMEGLYPAYQPKLDLITGAISGAEALVRWDHPTLGMIAPPRIISLAEKTGFISLITRRMIDEAVRFSAALRSQGLPSSISVNISILDLIETDLPGLIRQVLEKHGGMAMDLNLELTETSVSHDFEHTKGVLASLQSLGISLSVDDFGTGFSSLSYLSFFPIDEVKIDRSFVSDMVTNLRNQSIVRSTVLMAKELGLTTVAEGAEDSETQALLAAIGCDQLQGYVLSKPLPADEYRQLLRSHAEALASSSTKLPSTRRSNKRR